VSDSLVEGLSGLSESSSESIVNKGVLKRMREKRKRRRSAPCWSRLIKGSRKGRRTDLENLLKSLLDGESSLGGLLSDLDLLDGINNGFRSSVS